MASFIWKYISGLIKINIDYVWSSLSKCLSWIILDLMIKFISHIARNLLPFSILLPINFVSLSVPHIADH